MRAAGQLKPAGNAVKSGEFLGEFSWVEFDPVGIRGVNETRSHFSLGFDRRVGIERRMSDSHLVQNHTDAPPITAGRITYIKNRKFQNKIPHN